MLLIDFPKRQSGRRYLCMLTWKTRGDIVRHCNFLQTVVEHTKQKQSHTRLHSLVTFNATKISLISETVCSYCLATVCCWFQGITVEDSKCKQSHTRLHKLVTFTATEISLITETVCSCFLVTLVGKLPYIVPFKECLSRDSKCKQSYTRLRNLVTFTATEITLILCVYCLVTLV